MANASDFRGHYLPKCSINLNYLLDKMTEQEAEEHRKLIHDLGSTLYDAEIKERMMYGLLGLLWLMGLYWDVARLSDIPYYIIKVIFDLGIVVTSVWTYLAYRERKSAQHDYWKAIFGDAYHD